MTSSASRRKPINAAGCIVWKRAADGTLVVAVATRRDGSATWPKGKREEGETSMRTAVREALEETGMSVVAGAYLGATVFPTAGRVKLVDWYAAKWDSGRPAADRREFSKVTWMNTNDAFAQLTHLAERALLVPFSQLDDHRMLEVAMPHTGQPHTGQSSSVKTVSRGVSA